MFLIGKRHSEFPLFDNRTKKQRMSAADLKMNRDPVKKAAHLNSNKTGKRERREGKYKWFFKTYWSNSFSATEARNIEIVGNYTGLE
jgi:hypothetical protein